MQLLSKLLTKPIQVGKIVKGSVGSRENLHGIYSEHNNCKGPGYICSMRPPDLACLPVPSNSQLL